MPKERTALVSTEPVPSSATPAASQGKSSDGRGISLMFTMQFLAVFVVLIAAGTLVMVGEIHRQLDAAARAYVATGATTGHAETVGYRVAWHGTGDAPFCVETIGRGGVAGHHGIYRSHPHPQRVASAANACPAQQQG